MVTGNDDGENVNYIGARVLRVFIEPGLRICRKVNKAWARVLEQL